METPKEFQFYFSTEDQAVDAMILKSHFLTIKNLELYLLIKEVQVSQHQDLQQRIIQLSF